jgi:hypothetical protein
MATSALDVGDRVARQALVEKPEYVPSDDDLDAIFGISSTPDVVTLRSQYFVTFRAFERRSDTSCESVLYHRRHRACRSPQNSQQTAARSFTVIPSAILVGV